MTNRDWYAEDLGDKLHDILAEFIEDGGERLGGLAREVAADLVRVMIDEVEDMDEVKAQARGVLQAGEIEVREQGWRIFDTVIEALLGAAVRFGA